MCSASAARRGCVNRACPPPSPDHPPTACDLLQVQRVEHRVTVKKSLAVRLEQELSQAQLMANRGTKRKNASGQLVVSYTGLILFILLQKSLG